MKKVLLIAAVLFGFTAYAQDKSTQKAIATDGKVVKTAYGEPVDQNAAISISELNKKTDVAELSNITVYGTITEVCQAEGCWIRVSRETDEGSTMLVKFKDHAFVIPKDLAGRKVIFTGNAYQATISVEMLKHYAEDAGKSKEEIEKIKEPSSELAFEATGVVIR